MPVNRVEWLRLNGRKRVVLFVMRVRQPRAGLSQQTGRYHAAHIAIHSMNIESVSIAEISRNRIVVVTVSILCVRLLLSIFGVVRSADEPPRARGLNSLREKQRSSSAFLQLSTEGKKWPVRISLLFGGSEKNQDFQLFHDVVKPMLQFSLNENNG